MQVKDCKPLCQCFKYRSTADFSLLVLYITLTDLGKLKFSSFSFRLEARMRGAAYRKANQDMGR